MSFALYSSRVRSPRFVRRRTTLDLKALKVPTAMVVEKVRHLWIERHRLNGRPEAAFSEHRHEAPNKPVCRTVLPLLQPASQERNDCAGRKSRSPNQYKRKVAVQRPERRDE